MEIVLLSSIFKKISEDDFNERKEAALDIFTYFVHEGAFYHADFFSLLSLARVLLQLLVSVLITSLSGGSLYGTIEFMRSVFKKRKKGGNKHLNRCFCSFLFECEVNSRRCVLRPFCLSFWP